MKDEAEKVASQLRAKGYKTSVSKVVMRNLVGEEKVKYNVLATKNETVIRWSVSESHYEVSIRVVGEVDEDALEGQGYHVEKDGEYTRLFKKSKKPFYFMDRVP